MVKQAACGKMKLTVGSFLGVPRGFSADSSCAVLLPVIFVRHVGLCFCFRLFASVPFLFDLWLELRTFGRPTPFRELPRAASQGMVTTSCELVQVASFCKVCF